MEPNFRFNRGAAVLLHPAAAPRRELLRQRPWRGQTPHRRHPDSVGQSRLLDRVSGPQRRRKTHGVAGEVPRLRQVLSDRPHPVRHRCDTRLGMDTLATVKVLAQKIC